MLRDVRRTRVLLAVLVLAAFVLATLDARAGRGSPVDGVRALTGRVLGPVEAGVAGAVRPVGAAVAGAFGADPAELTRLRRQDAALRARLAVVDDPVAAGAADRLLGRAAAQSLRVVPARVVAVDAGLGASGTATIDVGSRDGVRRDLAVVAGPGLVGRVTAVTPATATVLLATDPRAQVGVRVAGSDELGVVTGQGRGPLRLRLLAADARLRVGDEVSTYGSPGGRPYAARVPVGRVVQVLRSDGGSGVAALVAPAVRFSTLDLVGVVVDAPRPPARRAATPPHRDPVVRGTGSGGH